MTAGIAQHLDHQVGAAVDHLGDVVKVRSRLDEAVQLDHAHDILKIAAGRRLHLRQQVDAADPRRGDTVLDAEIDTQCAFDSACAVIGELAGNMSMIARPHERHVVGDRRGRDRQGQAQGCQSVFGFGHGNLRMWRFYSPFTGGTGRWRRQTL